MYTIYWVNMSTRKAHIMKKSNNGNKIKSVFGGRISDPKIGIVGGQAVLEGVMMKSGDKCSLAVRTPDGGIKVSNSRHTSLRKKNKFFNIPIIRGIVGFIEQLALSMDMLTKSAEMQGVDLDEPESKFEKWIEKKFGDRIMKVMGGIGMVLVIGLALFVMLPTFAARGIDFLSGGFIGRYAVLRALVEGIIRIVIFVGYIWAVSLMPDIKRTYEYHGAEHKSVSCFEAGMELTPANAAKCTRFHPRCGTSFIFVMLIISIIVNSFLTWDNVWIRFGSKILLIPLIVGIGYEFIKYAGTHTNLFTKILSAPGLWMQRLTTAEPDEAQLEVAITALLNAIPEEFGGIDSSVNTKESDKTSGSDNTEHAGGDSSEKSDAADKTDN